jgi:hypothetical protein
MAFLGTSNHLGFYQVFAIKKLKIYIENINSSGLLLSLSLGVRYCLPNIILSHKNIETSKNLP